MAYGVFDLDDTSSPNRLLRRGLVYDSAPNSVQSLSTSNIREQVSYSWYADATDDKHPSSGSTVTVDPASKADAYSWLKAPRYNGAPMECGPLARMWVNGDYWAGVSVMGRHMARALEAQKITDAMFEWLDQLVVGDPVYDDTYSSGYSQSGEGLTEAPRGALGHWLSTASSSTRSATGGPAIGNYQVITPDLLERLADGRRQRQRPDGTGPGRHPGAERQPAGGGAAGHPLLRPLPFLRGARDAPGRQAAGRRPRRGQGLR